MEGHHGTCKHATLRDGSDIARTHMATESVLALCAVPERAAACLSDLPMSKCAPMTCTLRLSSLLTLTDTLTHTTCTHVHARKASLLPITTTHNMTSPQARRGTP